MNQGLLFVLLVFAVGIIWSISNYIKRHGWVDIALGVFCTAIIYGVIQLIKYAKGGYHV